MEPGVKREPLPHVHIAATLQELHSSEDEGADSDPCQGFKVHSIARSLC